MTNYRLHYFPESGNSYKLALMLTLCGRTFDPVWTDFGSGVTWTDEWRRTVNPTASLDLLHALLTGSSATWALGQGARQGACEADAQGGD